MVLTSHGGTILPLADLVTRITMFSYMVNAAPGYWQRYCDGLSAVASIQTVLDSILRAHPEISQLTVPDKGHQTKFIDYINKRLSGVRNDASTLLARFHHLDQSGRPRGLGVRKRLQRWLSETNHALMFIFNEDQIQSLIADVRGAESHLHLALTLACLNSSETRAPRLLEVIEELKTEMEEQAEKLGDWGNRIHSAQLQLISVKPPTSPDRYNDSPEQQSNGGQKKAKLEISKIIAQSIRSFKVSNGKEQDSERHPQQETSKGDAGHNDSDINENQSPGKAPPADTEGGSRVQVEEELSKDGDDVGNEDTPLTYIIRSDLGSHATSLFQVPVSSDGTIGIDLGQASGSTIVMRADEFADSLSQEEWEDAKHDSLDEFMERAASNFSTPYATDAEDDPGRVVEHPILRSTSPTSFMSLTGVQGQIDPTPIDASLEESNNPVSDAQSDDSHDDWGYDTDDSEHDTVRMSNSSGSLRSGDEDFSDYRETIRLLEIVKLDQSSEIPAEISWDDLVRFVLIADKSRQDYGEEPFNQARIWVSRFRPSKSFDSDALTWLWMTWKLQMDKEFKDLSAIIQRFAENQIVQDMAMGKRQIELPQQVFDLLNKGRTTAISRVQEAVALQIDMCQQRYAQAIAEINWWKYVSILQASLEFGYLHLGIYHVLRQQGSRNSATAFPAVSFRNLSRRIRSMVNLEDWKVSSVSPADRIPVPIAMLTTLIPVVGVGLHMNGVHGRLSSSCVRSLVALIEQMDAEEWGFHLSALSDAPG